MVFASLLKRVGSEDHLDRVHRLRVAEMLFDAAVRHRGHLNTVPHVHKEARLAHINPVLLQIPDYPETHH